MSPHRKSLPQMKLLLAISQLLVHLMIASALILVVCPSLTYAEIIEYNIVTDEFYGLNAERVLLVSDKDDADRKVKVVGKCKGRGATDLFLEDDPTNAREHWFIVSSESDLEPDLTICLSGNAPNWYEKAARPYK